MLEVLVNMHGAPRHLRSDNGPEFVATAILRWLGDAGIDTALIDPGKPWQNATDESFNGKFRDEFLSLQWFRNRMDAKVGIAQWRQHYNNDVPDHSTISRRKARLGKVASYERRTVKPVHLLIDSSGLSVHVGQLRTPPKARDYRKLHLAVDEQTSDVVACELTSKRARDASRVASLVGQIERPIASAKADAAYDTGDVYKTLENHRAHRSPKVLIPPRKGAQLALDSAGTRQRNRNIRARSRVGKRKWYVASGYSRRSKVETTFHRYKAILGSAMRARGLASQRVEVRLGCKILNTMTALGIPDGEMIG